MAKQILSDKTLRSVKPSDKDQRLNDGGGLYLLIKTNGAKWWRFVYPVIGLAAARRKAEDAHKQISNDIDPSDTRKQIKNDQRQAAENEKRLDNGLPLLNSFEYVAREWFASIVHTVNKTTHQKKIRRFEAHVFPIIGGMALSEIKSPAIYSLIKRRVNWKQPTASTVK